MKNYWILAILILSLLSCKKPKEEPIFEIIAYYWSMYDDFITLSNGELGDTTITYARNTLYAQIYKNGDCVVSKYRGPYQNELYSRFKIDTVVLNPVIRLFNDTKRDTIMIEKTEPGRFIYDGPSIRLIGNSKNKEKHTIRYNLTEYSNSYLVRLYNHINSKSDSIGSNEKFILSKEKRMKEIYDLEINLVPKPIKGKIKFTAPVIK